MKTKLEITVDPIRVIDKTLKNYLARQKHDHGEIKQHYLSRQVEALAVVLCQEIHENIKLK